MHYAVLGHGLLGAAVPEKERLCGLAAQQADDASLEVLYAAAGTGAALGCPIKLGAKVALHVGRQCCGSGIWCFFYRWNPGWVKNQELDPGCRWKGSTRRRAPH